MHLIKFKNRFEGEIYSNDTILSFGRCYSQNYPSHIIKDGWYIKLLVPFKQLRQYTVAHTFEIVKNFCRFSLLLRIRKSTISHYTGWVPV